jgi:predicted chitinase
MAKGVKKIKWVGSGGAMGNHSLEDTILCIRPNEEAPFVVGEWYNETTEDDKKRDITWLWMDQKRRTIFKRTIKPAGVPYGVNLPKKLCGNYAFYLEASLYGGHDHRKTGLHVYGKCDEKIISSSWSKKENAIDHSVVNYGDDLFIKLEAEGINGNSLTVQLYSVRKTDKPLEAVTTKCVDGRIKATFKTMSCYWRFPGLPGDVENFYIKVIDIKEDYIKNAGGSDKILSFDIIKTDSIITIPVFEIPTNTAPLTIDTTPVEEIVTTEGIVTAYFAKEEFIKETTEVDGQHEYKFANPNIKYDKNKIAGIIKSKVDALVKADKKYAKLDDIKNALVEESYEKDATITFNLCKLGAEYKKINSAPLEEEVYVVAKTFLLDGKEVSITIKEKDAVLGETDADLTVLEAKENGEELTILKATVENGIAKVKVKLRPKADEDLKVWKEKLLKGKKEEAYTYTFKSEETTITDDNKKQFAAIILKNAKEGKQGNTKITAGKTAFVDDVEKALENKTYKGGDPITFDTYKAQTESLWLKAECQGDTVKHEKEFLKRDGEYFVIGKGKCLSCNERISIEQIEKLFGVFTIHRAFRQEIIDNLNKYIFDSDKEIHINTCLRKAHFFAEIGAETLGINPDWMVETDVYRYSKSRCLDIFGDRAKDLNNSGLLDSYCSESPQKKLMNYMYANENGFGNGNGNEASADGYKYRGRGLKQLTGKGNYKSASEYIQEFFPNEYIDLEANPDKVKEAKYAVLSAIAYWEKHKIWETADTLKTSSDENIKNIRKIVNPGLAGWKDAKTYFEKGVDIFKVNSCSPIEVGDSTWSDPIDNPQRTYYNSEGVHKEQNGAFGPVRTKIVNGQSVPKNHQGLDIFADIDTPCKACLNGKIVSYMNEGNDGYGNVLVLEVSGKDLRNAKRNYNLEFTAEVESGVGFDINADTFYLRYAHLNSAVKTSGDVKSGETICYTGDTGNAQGVPNPHLHFEVAMKKSGNGSGLTNRYNPAFFVRLTDINQQEQEKVKNERS